MSVKVNVCACASKRNMRKSTGHLLCTTTQNRGEERASHEASGADKEKQNRTGTEGTEDTEGIFVLIILHNTQVSRRRSATGCKVALKVEPVEKCEPRGETQALRTAHTS